MSTTETSDTSSIQQQNQQSDNYNNNNNDNSGILRAIGFCGVDDTVDPNQLVTICNSYPIIEFGVLFRPDLEGQPRYATKQWVEKLVDTISNYPIQFDMKLAAHLCGSHVNNVLYGTADTFLNQLIQWKFRRIQINATARNGVDTSNLADGIPHIVRIVDKYTNDIEFIIQRNEETTVLWEGLETYYNKDHTAVWPKNLSMLYDESKGTGKETKQWPTIPSDIPYEIGFAGGIGPHNISTVLPELATIIIQASSSSLHNHHQPQRKFWIDMESSLRTIQNDSDDIFDLDKCSKVITVACNLGFVQSPTSTE